MSKHDTLRVGLIGINPEKGWAGMSHLPAIRATPGLELFAAAPARPVARDKGPRIDGARLSFGDYREMVIHPDIDVVVVTARVPVHHAAVMAALGAGKHVYCEWPLGRSVDEAVEMRDLRESAGTRAVVGFQARVSPILNRMRSLILEGYVGNVLSCTMIASTPTWGAATNSYLAERTNGATLLTIIGGHSLDALCYCAGEFAELSATVRSVRGLTVDPATGDSMAMSSPDQIAVQGVLEGGAVASVHLVGGRKHGTVFLFEVHGDRGDLTLSGSNYVQYDDSGLILTGAREGDTAAVNLFPEPPDEPAIPRGKPANVARLYRVLQEGIRSGRGVTPDFDLAVSRHRLIQSIERASDSGALQKFSAH